MISERGSPFLRCKRKMRVGAISIHDGDLGERGGFPLFPTESIRKLKEVKLNFPLSSADRIM